MKRLTALLLLFLIVLGGCTGTPSDSAADRTYDETVTTAIAALQEAWEEKYRESPLETRVNDIYIKNTRVIKVREGCDFPLLNDAVCVVEFIILSDYFGSQGRYFRNAGILDTVIFYRDGHTEVPERSEERR